MTAGSRAEFKDIRNEQLEGKDEGLKIMKRNM